MAKIRPHLFFLGLLFFSLLVFGWLITFGSFQFWGYSYPEATYAATWFGLIHGRFDIPPEAVAELFVRDGHYYTYFGPFPALIRGLLTPFIEIHVPAERLTMMLGSLLIVFLIYLTGLQLVEQSRKNKLAFRLALASLVLASPLMYVSTLAIVYNEAILWATVQCLLFNLLIIKYIFQPNRRGYGLIIGIVAAATLTALTRASTILGPAAVLILLTANYLYRLIRKQKEVPPEFVVPWRAALAAGLVGTIVLFSAFYVNYQRWGNPFDFSGAQYMSGFVEKPWLWEAFKKGGLFAWDRIPATLENYFFPHDDNFVNQWPYFVPSNKILDARPFARHFGNIEPYGRFPMPMTFPLIVFLSVVGLIGLNRTRKRGNSPRDFLLFLIVLGNAATWIGIFTFCGISARYECDFLPLLTILTFMGVRYGDKFKFNLNSTRLKIAASAVFAVSVFVTIMATIQINVYLDHDPKTKEWILGTFRIPSALYDRPLPPWEAENVFKEWKAQHPESDLKGP